ncbi:MAG TPA: response regulator transcription factor [Anaerolineales bacterium]|nr:response regulator transcription factor [Anaerolineales bacterium]
MTETKSIRVLIADDFKFLRDVIRSYLEQAADMEVVDEARDVTDALESAIALRPDVIIMNDYLPPIDSAHAAALFRKQGVTAAIVVISVQPEADLIQRSFRSGINGIMDTDEIDDYLVGAIRQVHQGERYLSPRAQDASPSIEE